MIAPGLQSECLNADSPFHRHIGPWLGTHKQAARPKDAVIFALLKDMGQPSRASGRGEDRREQVPANTQHGVHGPGIEIDVGIYGPAFGLHATAEGVLDFLEELVEPLVSSAFAELGQELFHDRCPWILGFIHSVPHAHDFAVLAEGLVQPGLDVFLVADFIDHIHYAFVGTAVKESGQGADGGGDAAIAG